MSNICLRKKRAPFATNKKKANPQRELDEELLAIEAVDADSCWRVYRLDEDACKLHIPPQPKLKNCKQNPYCIHRIGFEKIEKMFQSLAEGKSVAEVLVRRNPKEQPCGLVNTGNFCYLNSFLQIWFNDLRFRQSIFDWRPELGWTQPADAKLDIQEVLNCLQRLFITLQNTPFDSTDPKDFINLLRLDNQQQDVQEFHTLFFDTLQRNLELHPNGKQICNTINELFLSRVRQTTFCRRCDNERIAHCEYRSLLLSIDGLSSLDAAIEKFFQPESLTDFKCKCGEKGTTDKLMAFEVLPQVLIIQLIRYVYDSSKEQHRKLKTAISYPRILKANKLKQDAPANEEYELTAVMIHEGPNSHCGHYYDIIRDPLTGKWYSYNDKRVEPEKRLPGYEGNKQPKEITRGTNDQKGCYALIYQRKLPAVKNAKIQLRLPPEEVVRGVCKKLEDDFARQSKEGTLSNELWVNRINQRYTLLNKLIREMEIDKGRSFMKKSEEIAFLPTSLLADLFTKEFDAIKQMHSIEDANAMLQSPNANGHKALCRDESTFSFDGMEHDEANHSNQSQDYTKYEDLYAPEPLSDVDFVLCKHENLPLDALLKGQIKAVRKLGAQRLIKEFNVRFRLRTWDEDRNKTSDETKMEEVTENDRMTPDQPCTSASIAKTPVKNGIINGPAEGTKGNNELIDPFLTGKDLCFECVKELKSQASYRNNLQETEKQLAETLRGLAKRTYDSNRGNPFPSIEPPEKAVWVALEHLKKFKKIALDQMENANDLGMDDDDEPIEKRSKDEEILDDENEQGEMQTPKKKADTREIQLVINVDPEQDQQDGEIITEFHFDSEGNEVKMVGRKEKEQNSDGEVEIIEETRQKAVKFNQDLYCKHGKLSCKTKRAWLTEEEWNKLKSSFIEYCDPIPCTAPECPDCLEERNIIDLVRNNSLDQFQALQNDIKTLLNKISVRRPCDGNGRGNKCTHVICGEFVAKMRNLGRGRPKNIFEIPPICQNCLLCNHGLPYLPLAHENDEEAAIKLFPIFRGKTNELEHAKGIPILETEWRDLVNAYKKHVPEQIQPTAILLQENGHYLDFCDDCHLEFLRGEEMKRYIYPEGANIFIRVQRDDTDGQSGASMLMTTRRCVQKNLIKLKMRSDQTILDLKMDLMQQVRQSPIDQLLYLDERVLDNGLTLEASRVPANNQDNPLTLILQQHSAADESLGANGAGPRQPEKGFQDTALA